MKKMKIKKGDKVIVLSGRDRGKVAVVEKVFMRDRMILLPKINVVKKHVKVSKENPTGGVVEVERPIPVSKVQLICPHCDKRTRVGYKLLSNEKKRVCKKCGKIIEAKKEEKE